MGVSGNLNASNTADADVFDSVELGGVRLRNRFVRSATGERASDSEGRCTPALIELVRRLAEGGVGLIIPGHACVSLEGRADPRQMGIYDDSMLDGLRRLTSAAHDGGAAVFVQLTHAGARADGSSGLPLKSSVSSTTDSGLKVEAMTRQDIARLVVSFGDAAERARNANFDGVQIHFGHGYGLCQFVSPFLNGRSDEYGGSLENRMRIVMEIYREVRRRVGKNFPVIAKMNCDDFIDGGTTPEMMTESAGMLEAEGLDAVEMSGGIGHPKARYGGARTYNPKNESEEVYYREAAKLCKSRIRIPLILVGGIRRLPTTRRLVSEGTADFVSLCRPLIREPHLISRWQGGDAERAACISCNGCGRTAAEYGIIRCVFDKDRKEGLS